MILVQFKYFTLRHVCNTLNKIIKKQKNISDPWIFSVLYHDVCIFKKRRLQSCESCLLLPAIAIYILENHVLLNFLWSKFDKHRII